MIISTLVTIFPFYLSPYFPPNSYIVCDNPSLSRAANRSRGPSATAWKPIMAIASIVILHSSVAIYCHSSLEILKKPIIYPIYAGLSLWRSCSGIHRTHGTVINSYIIFRGQHFTMPSPSSITYAFGLLFHNVP